MRVLIPNAEGRARSGTPLTRARPACECTVVLTQNVTEEPGGVALFLPAGYDLVWSVVALAALAGVGALVVLVVRALTREPAPALHGLADGDPVRRAARRHATTVSVAAATAAALSSGSSSCRP